MQASPPPVRFNLRVYGVCVRESKLLVSDEHVFGVDMTKLPGGGLELGEGVHEGLRREWREELDTEIEIGELLFVTPFFLVSHFDERDQVICFYYEVQPERAVEWEFDETGRRLASGEDDQFFRWIPLDQLQPEHLTWPSDQAWIRQYFEK